MYKLVAFDAYGTIFDVYSISKLGEELFPGQGQALSLMWRDRQIEYTRLVSMADPAELGSRFYTSFWDLTIQSLRYTCERLGLPLSESSESALMHQYSRLEIFPDVINTLTLLKNKGIHTAILSNGSQKMLQDVVEKNALTAYFDRLVSVDDVKHFKVMPQAYRLLLDKFSCQQQDVLFVSCNAWDIVGAGWFGLPTYWVNRFHLPFEKIGLPPTFQGPSLTKLTQHI